MNTMRHVVLSVICILTAFTLVLYSSCKKDRCEGVMCLHGGVCADGECECPTGFSGSRCEIPDQTIIYFRNNVFTPVILSVNNSSSSVSTQSMSYVTGPPGTVLKATAYTYEPRFMDTIPLGERVTWDITARFPDTGSIVVPLDLDSSMFFLMVKNMISGNPVKKLIVNYGLPGERQEGALDIVNDGSESRAGYYHWYANSNVRLESDAKNWFFPSLSFPTAKNKVITVTAD